MFICGTSLALALGLASVSRWIRYPTGKSVEGDVEKLAGVGRLPEHTGRFHNVPLDDPELFNTTIERFLSTPFSKKDRIADAMKSYEKLLAGLPK